MDGHDEATPPISEAEREEYRELYEKLAGDEGIESVIVGKRRVIDQTLATHLAGGHVLLEDVPGVGKTTLVKALALCVKDASFGRIQGTPDLEPTDVTGWVYLDDVTHERKFSPGPIFNNFVLGDEINRAHEKVQSAFHEAMEEGTVTPPGEHESYSVPKPFLVILAINPNRMMGTVPLVESNLDRILLRLSIGYPETFEDEKKMALAELYEHPLKRLKRRGPVIHIDDLARMQKVARSMPMREDIGNWLIEFVMATRPGWAKSEVGIDISDLVLPKGGASPRNTSRLIRLAKTWAFVNGDEEVTCARTQEIFEPYLGHRIQFTENIEPTEEDEEAALKELIGRILDEKKGIGIPESL